MYSSSRKQRSVAGSQRAFKQRASTPGSQSTDHISSKSHDKATDILDTLQYETLCFKIFIAGYGIHTVLNSYDK